MKTLWIASVFLAVTAMGCVSSSQEKTKGTIWHSHTEPPAPPVTPAQVKPENAHKVSQDLWNEMDRQAEDELLKENEAKAAPPKK